MMDRDVSDEFDTTLSLRRFVRHDFVFFFLCLRNGVTFNPCKYVHGILACDQYTIVNNHGVNMSTSWFSKR